jgi:hypothetical protein
MSLLTRLAGSLPSVVNRNQTALLDNWQKIEHGHFSEDDEPRSLAANIGFSLGQHTTIAGATGSGKTVFGIQLVEYYRRRYPFARRYILNSTGDAQFASVVGATEDDSDAPPFYRLKPAYTLVWSPGYDNLEAYDAWLHWLLSAREESVIFLDDIASMILKNGKPLPGHMKLMKQGRKHGITVINGTQTTTSVPQIMFNQMTHFIQLRLGNSTSDLYYARQYLDMTKEDYHAPRSEYGFFYKRIGVQYPVVEYGSYTDLFKRR